jgi:hypothetical protein
VKDFNLDPTLLELKQGTRLAPTEIAGIFDLVLAMPLPSAADQVEWEVGILLMAADILKTHEVETMQALSLLKRLWADLQDHDEPPALLHLIDRRYVAWATVSKHGILFDTIGGAEISDTLQLPEPILESVVYTLPELLRRRMQLVRGERLSLWGGKDAASHTPRQAEGESSRDLDRSEVIRDDPAQPVPR